jgi:hypothetical protein
VNYDTKECHQHRRLHSHDRGHTYQPIFPSLPVRIRSPFHWFDDIDGPGIAFPGVPSARAYLNNIINDKSVFIKYSLDLLKSSLR